MGGPHKLRVPPRVAPPIDRTRRPEGVRWLRSDGTPNWNQRVKRWSGELERIARRPPISIQRSSTVMEAAEAIARHRIRGLPVLDFTRVVGVVTATDLVNYLGGGPHFEIIVKRYAGNIFKALNEERVSSIMSRSPFTVSLGDRLEKVIEIMISKGVGFLPVVQEENEIYGVITERDIVSLMHDKKIGVPVRAVMSSPIVSIDEEEPLKRAAEMIVRSGFRRLVVTRGEEISGFLSAKDYVLFFGSHRAFSRLQSMSVEDALRTPVSEIMERRYETIDADADAGEACARMLENNIDWLLVTKGEEALGIFTERDALIALAMEV